MVNPYYDKLTKRIKELEADRQALIEHKGTLSERIVELEKENVKLRAENIDITSKRDKVGEIAAKLVVENDELMNERKK